MTSNILFEQRHPFHRKFQDLYRTCVGSPYLGSLGDRTVQSSEFDRLRLADGRMNVPQVQQSPPADFDPFPGHQSGVRTEEYAYVLLVSSLGKNYANYSMMKLHVQKTYRAHHSFPLDALHRQWTLPRLKMQSSWSSLQESRGRDRSGRDVMFARENLHNQIKQLFLLIWKSEGSLGKEKECQVYSARGHYTFDREE